MKKQSVKNLVLGALFLALALLWRAGLRRYESASS